MKCPCCGSIIKNRKPALAVIHKFGGVAKMAELTGIKKQTIYRWTYPKNKHNGTGGQIPARHHQLILATASVNDIDVVESDLV